MVDKVTLEQRFEGVADRDSNRGVVEPAVVTLTRKEPAGMAGQTHRPNTRQADKAIPLGAQMALGLGWTSAKPRPILPSAM
jgi:hypothetical protein